MNSHQLAALQLIANGGKLTEKGNVIVSRQAKSLKEMGLIIENPKKWIAYDLTSKGKEVLKEADNTTL